MSINSKWLLSIPGHNYNGAISLLNSLDWNISFRKSDREYKVFAGDQLLYKSTYEKEIEAFIFGMALSLSVLPGDILDRIREIIKE
jgi:hypothetical protein